MGTPKFLKADVERGLILAYYELVKGCVVSLDLTKSSKSLRVTGSEFEEVCQKVIDLPD